MDARTGVLAGVTGVLAEVGDDGVTGTRVAVELAVPVPRAWLWRLITDPGRAAEFSPECQYAGWLDGAGPRPGARFAGRNRYPDGSVREVVCVVTEARPPSSYAWSVLDGSGDPERAGSLWRYELLPGGTPGTTVVRHAFEHGPGDTGARRGALRDAASLGRRLGQLRDDMTTTLTAMADAYRKEA